jgi:hypothetical protein
MAEFYNPVVRTFNRVRTILMEEFGVPRECVRPWTPIEGLVPPEEYHRLRDRLSWVGFDPPRSGHLPVVNHPLCFAPLLTGPLFLVAIALKSWPLALLTLAQTAFAFWLACKVTTTRTRYFPLVPATVGEMVIFLIRFADHDGYRFSRSEIALKVRMLVAEFAGVALERITEKTSFTDDLE